MVHPAAGIFPAISISRSNTLSDLGIFIDESGDVGSNSEFYLITMILHDQASSIERRNKSFATSSIFWMCILKKQSTPVP